VETNLLIKHSFFSSLQHNRYAKLSLLCTQTIKFSLDLSNQYIISYTVAFLSPEPVTIYLSSEEMSTLNTDEDSFD